MWGRAQELSSASKLVCERDSIQITLLSKTEKYDF